jgi:hypothetical protein
MKSIEEHKEKLKVICDYAFSYGINSIKSKVEMYSSPKSWNKKTREKFIEKCNDGFKISQNLIIEEILNYQKILRVSNLELKEARRNREKETEKELKSKISIIEHRLNVFSHIADGIAWQLIQGQIHISKRLYINEGSKFLDSSNLEHAIKISSEINENPKQFALISDLTNFIQIGDLLVKFEDKIGIMELKEGKINEKIADFIDKLKDDKITVEELSKDIEKFDKNTINQLSRVIRQQERAFRAIKILNTDNGSDPKSGKKMAISSPKTITKLYSNVFDTLISRLENSTWAFEVIDKSSLYIGVYKDKGRLLAPFVIEDTIKQVSENYVIIDFMSIVSNVSEPLFAKPLSPECLIDILVGDLKIIIGFDIDAFIKILNETGFEAELLSEKETMKLKQKETDIKIMFIINKRAIQIKNLKNNKSMIVGGGIISKILYDSIYPTNIALTLFEMLSQEE